MASALAADREGSKVFPLLIPIMIGMAGGALANKKNPLKGAMLGGAIGATGGLLAPAAGAAAAGAGAAGAGAAGTAGASGAFLGEGVASGIGAWDAAAAGSAAATPTAGASTGLLGGMNSAMTQAKPYMDTAGQVQGLLGQQQEEAPPIPPQIQSFSNNLPELSAQLMEQAQAEQANSDAERRKRRMGLLGMG
jgi:hypothetical protein